MFFKRFLIICLAAGFIINASAQTLVYRVLIAYSQEFAATFPTNPMTPIDEVVNWLNNSVYATYPTDLLGEIRLEVVCVWNSGYHQLGWTADDLDNLRNTGGTYSALDDITKSGGLREKYRADICVLLFHWEMNDGNMASGQSAGWDPGPNAMYCVVGVANPNWIVPNFAHEIGHLFGCGHQQGATTGDFSPYAFGHGYGTTDPVNRWINYGETPPDTVPFTTIMWNGVCIWGTLPRFSSPDTRLIYGAPGHQEVIGVTETNDNTRLVRGRMDNTVHQPAPNNWDSLGNYQRAPATITLGGGLDTIGNFESKMPIATSTITIGNGFTVRPNGRFTARVTSSPLGKRVAPAEENGKVTIPAKTTALPEKLSLKVTVAKGALTLKYSIPKESKVRAHILDAQGRHVLSVSLGKKTSGFYKEDISTLALGSGQYCIVLDADGKRSSQAFFNLR